jgi:integrase
MRDGTVYQRHLRSCPRDVQGVGRPHKCRGQWGYVVDVGRDELTGKRQQVTRSGFATKAAAKSALREAMDSLQHAGAAAHALTTGDFLEQWLAGKRALRPGTRESYRSHLELYLLPHLRRIRLSDLRASHLDGLFNAISTEGARGQLSRTTVRRVHATLRNALNAAVRRRLIAFNPATQVELAVPRRTSIAVWTPEQLGSFLDAIADERLYGLYHLVAMTGLRRGEAIGVRWGDVDLDAGEMRVAQSITMVQRQLVVGEPKTKGSARVLPLDGGTVAVLRSHRARQAAKRLAWGAGWSDTGLVFTREDGTVLLPEHVTRGFQVLAKRAGLPPIRFHALRHTSASLALAAGVPMKVVSERLGHSSTGITADLYTHVSAAVGRDAADAIAGIVPRQAADRRVG